MFTKSMYMCTVQAHAAICMYWEENRRELSNYQIIWFYRFESSRGTYVEVQRLAHTYVDADARNADALKTGCKHHFNFLFHLLHIRQKKTLK